MDFRPVLETTCCARVFEAALVPTEGFAGIALARESSYQILLYKWVKFSSGCLEKTIELPQQE
jgi:hypothetical protein